MKLSGKTIIFQNPEVISKEIKENIYIFDDQSGLFYSLNETGSFIWRITKTPVSIENIVLQMTDEFSVDKNTATGDCMSYISSFVQKGIFRISKKRRLQQKPNAKI